MTHKHITDSGKVGGFNAPHPLVIRSLAENMEGRGNKKMKGLLAFKLS